MMMKIKTLIHLILIIIQYFEYKINTSYIIKEIKIYVSKSFNNKIFHKYIIIYN
jgi:hypothetical protein